MQRDKHSKRKPRRHPPPSQQTLRINAQLKEGVLLAMQTCTKQAHTTTTTKTTRTLVEPIILSLFRSQKSIPPLMLPKPPKHRNRPCGLQNTELRCATPNSNTGSPTAFNICKCKITLKHGATAVKLMPSGSKLTTATGGLFPPMTTTSRPLGAAHAQTQLSEQYRNHRKHRTMMI